VKLADKIRNQMQDERVAAVFKNGKAIAQKYQDIVDQIESTAKEGKTCIEWASLFSCKDDDTYTATTACNLEVCKRLEAEGFRVSQNHSLRDFCWHDRSAVTISWGAK
jgi:hypothetical protein